MRQIRQLLRLARRDGRERTGDRTAHSAWRVARSRTISSGASAAGLAWPLAVATSRTAFLNNVLFANAGVKSRGSAGARRAGWARSPANSSGPAVNLMVLLGKRIARFNPGGLWLTVASAICSGTSSRRRRLPWRPVDHPAGDKVFVRLLRQGKS